MARGKAEERKKRSRENLGGEIGGYLCRRSKILEVTMPEIDGD